MDEHSGDHLNTAQHSTHTQRKEKKRELTEMRFHMKERTWDPPEVFIVRDDECSALFEICGEFANIDDDLVLIDRATAQELARAHIRQHMPSLTLHYAVYRNGQVWAHMHDRFRLFHENFKIDISDGSTLRVRGDTLHWNFSVINETGQPLAHIGRQYSIFPDCYAIEVAQDVDAVGMVVLVIVMDIVRERQEQAAQRRK